MIVKYTRPIKKFRGSLSARGRFSNGRSYGRQNIKMTKYCQDAYQIVPLDIRNKNVHSEKFDLTKVVDPNISDVVNPSFMTRCIKRNNLRLFSSKSEHFENVTPVQGF